MGPYILAATLILACVQTLRADTFTLKDGTVIEGAVIRATKSSIAVKRAIGGLQLLRLSSIDEVQVERPGKEPVAGRLVGWTEGVHIVDVGDKIIEMRDGKIQREISSQPINIATSAPAAPTVGQDEVQSSSQRRAKKERAAATRPDPDDQADRVSPHLAASPTSLEPTSQPETKVELTPAVAPAAKVETVVNSPPGTGGEVMIDVSTASAHEGETIQFDLRLSQPLARPLMVVYATIGGTAKEGADFEAQRGIVTFEPGDTTLEVRTMLIDDDLAEGEERFSLFLSVDPALATLGERQVSATVLDND